MTQVSEAPPEPARLAAVRRTALLDTPPEEAFDRLTRLAARLLGTQIALISLVEDDRQFFVSATGLAEPLASSRTTPISYSFCRHVVESKARLVVEDARRHPLVRTNPAIRELGWVSYAGVPLTDRDGHVLGALSVIDAMPRLWSERDLDLLQDLAVWAVTEIELRALSLRKEALPIFEETGVAMAIVAADGRCLRANKALGDLVGTRPSELVGRPIEELTHEDDRAADREALRLLRAGECRSFTAEKRVLGESGEPCWVLATTTHLPEAGSHREQFIVAFQESTGQARFETEAREREEKRYRLVVESTHDVIWDWDLLTDRVVWSSASGGFLGYGMDQLGDTAAWWYERLHPDERERVVAAIHGVVARGESLWNDAHQFRRADGGWADMEVRGSVVRDEAGDAVRMVVATLDVTERKRAELAARHQSALLRDIAAGMELDEALRGIMAFTEAHTGGAAAIDLVGDDGGPHSAVETSMPSSAASVFPLVATDGTALGTLTIVRSEPESSDPDAGVVQIATDLACLAIERERTHAALLRSEDQLRQAQKMEAVGQLAGGIAQDFNNLLTGILSYTDLVLEELPQADPIRADIEQIRHAGHRAAALTRQLLAFSRRQVLQPRVISLNTVVSDLETMLRKLVPAGIALDVMLEPGLWYVMADAGQLEQVLVNLTANARDAMPDGGRLTITTANCRVGAEGLERAAGVRPGAYAVLSVADTGLGMDVATQARIFEPFFTTKHGGGGGGLGLSSVYGIVEQSGGHISVQSAPGRGATFSIYLPRHAEPGAPAANTPDRRTLPVGTETLLLVEDEATVRSSARRLLERHGYTVVEARHGVEALQVAEEAGVHFDLVLTDVVMPEMGGRELVERLRARSPGLKVLFMSGYSERAIAADGTMPPGTGFVEKPFTVEQLLRRLRRVLDG